MSAIAICLGTISSGNCQEKSNIIQGTSYQSDSLNYQMVGYEDTNNRFWVVIDTITAQSQIKLSRIINDIFNKNKDKFNLSNIKWHVSFFSNEEEAGYKTFKPESYLAEYSGKKVKIYPMLPNRTKWFYIKILKNK